MSVGITENKEIFVIGNQGIESAAVTLALRDLGYKLAANYAGGYVELLAFAPRK
jgi:3-mercaptopyruvate sulfurtransferase SseA